MDGFGKLKLVPEWGLGVGMNHPVTDFQHGKAALDWAEADREIVANKITKLATKLEMYWRGDCFIADIL